MFTFSIFFTFLLLLFGLVTSHILLSSLFLFFLAPPRFGKMGKASSYITKGPFFISFIFLLLSCFSILGVLPHVLPCLMFLCIPSDVLCMCFIHDYGTGQLDFAIYSCISKMKNIWCFL